MIWFAAFVAVNVLDAALTMYALRLGGSEGNPVLRLLMRRLPPVAALALVKGVLTVGVWYWIAELEQALPWAVGAFGAVCVWNVVQIDKLRRYRNGS